MSKKIKIMYLALFIINVVICIVDIIIARYGGAIIMGISALYLLCCFWLSKIICDQNTLIVTCIGELKNNLKRLKESVEREEIAKLLLTEMRQRAEEAERKLKELQDNTPARGKDGRYIKREH